MFNTTQIIQHVNSGEYYVISLTEDGAVIDTACGPVTLEDAEYTVNEAFGFFDYEAGLENWITDNWNDFVTIF